MITIKKEISITGKGLMKNKPCTVNFFPSEEGKIRYFVKGKDAFTADIEHVISTEHCVTLGDKSSRAILTEHLTAALAFCRRFLPEKVPEVSDVWALDANPGRADDALFEDEKFWRVLRAAAHKYRSESSTPCRI